MGRRYEGPVAVTITYDGKELSAEGLSAIRLDKEGRRTIKNLVKSTRKSDYPKDLSIRIQGEKDVVDQVTIEPHSYVRKDYLLGEQNIQYLYINNYIGSTSRREVKMPILAGFLEIPNYFRYNWKYNRQIMKELVNASKRLRKLSRSK